ncbi:MAG TPA: esterase-like activity of phytase family protein [Alphaproteobacteria bacterium]
MTVPLLYRLVLAALLTSLACGGSAALAEPIGSLRFMGAVTVPNDARAGRTLIGGLSGLDYDAATDSFVVVSDDRSEYAPARFYDVKLAFQDDRLAAVAFLKATPLLQANGRPYPNGMAGGDIPDPESIRIDPANPDRLWWTSEGDRSRRLKPAVREIDRQGRQLFALPVPAMFDVHPGRESGPRNNLAFEALSFSADGQTLWVGMEEALYEDGPVASVDHGAVSRITHYGRDGQLLGQFAYPIDAIPAKPGPGKAADNGVSEILALDDSRLLVLERSGVQASDGSYSVHIRLYEADIEGATDVSSLSALAGADYRPMAKRLVVNLDHAGVGRVDNLEGVSWGPRLGNGHRTLVLVSDNNFNKDQVTQFLAFEVLP